MRLSLGFDSLAVVSQVALGHTKVSSEEKLHGEESVDVTGRVSKDTYRTTVDSRVPGARPSIGHTVMQGERVTSVSSAEKRSATTFAGPTGERG